jgi:hypothetical protein
MGVAPEIPPIPNVYQGKNGRRHGRIHCPGIVCNFGDVLDLSASGARIQFRGRLPVKSGDQIELQIKGVNGLFPVMAKVVWIRRAGWRKQELGLEFMDIDGQTLRELTTVARRAAAVTESVRRLEDQTVSYW